MSTCPSRIAKGLYKKLEEHEAIPMKGAAGKRGKAGNGDRAAIIYDSPVTNTKRTISYSELRDRVASLAGALRALRRALKVTLRPFVILGACSKINQALSQKSSPTRHGSPTAILYSVMISCTYQHKPTV